MILEVRNCFIKAIRRYKNTSSVEKNKSYSNTVLLPQTKLPLRLTNKKLIERDEHLTTSSAFIDLYKEQEKHEAPEFVLHDGPPYANGELHMGHAINKILKDTILRHQILRGKRVSYIPGWDCHGLPIELKAVTNNQNLTPIEIRKKARSFATETIDNQKKIFQSWGVMGDWNNAYMTFDKSYLKNQLQVFYQLYEKKLIYRDIKPVYWSPSSRTALAEAELEYKSEHKSKAVYLKLKIHNLPKELGTNNGVYALTWTTTPWTLPSNQAICFNPKLSYSLVQKVGSPEIFIVATNLIKNIENIWNCQFNILNTFLGEELSEVTYHHPLVPNDVLPFLPADHASDTKGTGLVHTAPAHGLDDYNIGTMHKLLIKNYVDEEGNFTSEAGPILKGLSVLSDGNDAVLQLLQNNIIHSELYTHSYPYDWRTKQPVILRSSKQWFIDTDALKDRAINFLEQVEVFPKVRSEIYKKNLINQLERRPSWCISRQRTWGVPIPVFYNAKSGLPIIERVIIDHMCSLIDEHGTDYWWNLDLKQLLPAGLLTECNISAENIVKGSDIFDIWFDSGLSWLNVLKGDQVADLYVEGVDQFTGWFQSSLITSVALRNKSPYKSIYVHGFAVDENGLKMSKSLGNIVDPQVVIQGKKGQNAYGIDALRWWVVCHANSDAIAQIGKTVLQASSDEVQKIRSVLRFALGALHDYKPQAIDLNNMLLIDKYLLHLTCILKNQVFELYERNELNNKLSHLIINFLTGPVSALYYLAIKDRLYCNEANSSGRISAQFVLFEIFNAVTQCVAPILPHLAEELYSNLPQKQDGSFFQNTRVFTNLDLTNEKVADVVENLILNVKKDIHKNVGAETLTLDVEIQLSQDLFLNVQEIQCDMPKLCDELVDILQVSQVTVVECTDLENDMYSLSISDSSLFMCDRCRRVFAEEENTLCNRCHDIVSNLYNKTAAES